MFYTTIAKLGLKKQDRTSKAPAMVRNYFNKAINKAALLAIRGKKISGAITIWEGPSEFDGTPIKVVMTGYIKDSENEKTGPLVQVFILPSDEKPINAFKAKKSSVCGDCIYNGGGCYVNWGRLTPTWTASKRKFISLELASWLVTGLRVRLDICRAPAGALQISLALASWLVTGLRVRLGAAGDPSAVPTYVWETLLKGADSWTGYTHSWKNCDPALRRIVMASCDNDDETKQAISLGWNVFHVHDGKIDDNIDYVRCLSGSPDSNGLPKTCFSCMMCHGVRSSKARPLVVAEKLHGSTATLSQARKARKIS